MVLLPLLAMLTVCSAIPQDLQGKTFTFPQATNTAHVRLTTTRQDLKAVTVCLRFFTDLQRDQSLFSLATPSNTNAFLVFKLAANDGFAFWGRDGHAEFRGMNYRPTMWHSLCSTWESASGLARLWLDGKPSSRKFTSSGSSINGPIIIVFGQDQDAYGGGFDINQSLVGMMRDVHMWDYIISPSEIRNYAQEYLSFSPGNVLNWRALEFQTIGRVLVEDIDMIGR